MVWHQRSLRCRCLAPGKSEREILPGQTGTVRRYALPGSIAMQRLVSPELKVYTISDREALSELVTELRLDSTLAGNLRQLLGYQTAGPGRQARQMVGLKHLESGKLVPVVGSNAIRIFKRYCCPQTPDAH